MKFNEYYYDEEVKKFDREYFTYMSENLKGKIFCPNYSCCPGVHLEISTNKGNHYLKTAKGKNHDKKKCKYYFDKIIYETKGEAVKFDEEVVDSFENQIMSKINSKKKVTKEKKAIAKKTEISVSGRSNDNTVIQKNGKYIQSLSLKNLFEIENSVSGVFYGKCDLRFKKRRTNLDKEIYSIVIIVGGLIVFDVGMSKKQFDMKYSKLNLNEMINYKDEKFKNEYFIYYGGYIEFKDGFYRNSWLSNFRLFKIKKDGVFLD